MKLTDTPINLYHQHDLNKDELSDINKFLHQMAMQISILKDKMRLLRKDDREKKNEIQIIIDKIQHRCVKARNCRFGFGHNTY